MRTLRERLQNIQKYDTMKIPPSFEGGIKSYFNNSWISAKRTGILMPCGQCFMHALQFLQ